MIVGKRIIGCRLAHIQEKGRINRVSLEIFENRVVIIYDTEHHFIEIRVTFRSTVVHWILYHRDVIMQHTLTDCEGTTGDRWLQAFGRLQDRVGRHTCEDVLWHRRK